jgi:hypothetical protein
VRVAGGPRGEGKGSRVKEEQFIACVYILHADYRKLVYKFMYIHLVSLLNSSTAEERLVKVEKRKKCRNVSAAKI